MRVKLSTNPPLPPLKAWFPLALQSLPTIASFKSLLCTSIPAFHALSPTSLRLSIDGFELLDSSELAIVRDGDLISIDKCDVPSEDATTRLGQTVDAAQKRPEPAPSRKRKRPMTTPSSSSSGSESESATSSSESTTSSSESESESESEASDSEAESSSDEPLCPTAPSLQNAEPSGVKKRAQIVPSEQPKPHVVQPTTFVAPGYGKPQTRSRNLRRRLKRMHEREAVAAGPVSGANAVVRGKETQAQAITPIGPDASQDANDIPTLLSLSLRNKNKAKNFKSLMNRPLAPKIIFRDQEGDDAVATFDEMAASDCPTQAGGLSKPQAHVLPRLIPPSSRTSLPPNVFVTSVDVEAGMHKGKKKRKMQVEYEDKFEEEAEEDGDVTLDYGDNTAAEPKTDEDIEGLESIAEKDWATLEKPTDERQVGRGMFVGYKALGIDPVTCTPEQRLTLGEVVTCDARGISMWPLRRYEEASFSGPAGPEEAEDEEEYTWDDVINGDWRVLPF